MSQLKSVRKPDPRTDVLIDVGVVLRGFDNVQIGDSLSVFKHATEPGQVLFVVVEDGSVVFEAVVHESEVELGAYRHPETWASVLSSVSDVLRKGA